MLSLLVATSLFVSGSANSCRFCSFVHACMRVQKLTVHSCCLLCFGPSEPAFLCRSLMIWGPRQGQRGSNAGIVLWVQHAFSLLAVQRGTSKQSLIPGSWIHQQAHLPLCAPTQTCSFRGGSAWECARGTADVFVSVLKSLERKEVQWGGKL